MRIVIRRPADGSFFNGEVFSAIERDAFAFRDVHQAIELIRFHKWIATEILLLYRDGSTIRASGDSFDVPNDVRAGLAQCIAQSVKRRELARARRIRSPR